jgi:hypothetical protein
MKRRLKNEIASRKKGTPTERKNYASDGTVEDKASKEFEESLMRLASFAKGRIKYEDFTSKDKFNILDLFVNNEKTLIKIYEALFPHRVVTKPSQHVTNSNSPHNASHSQSGRLGGMMSDIPMPSNTLSFAKPAKTGGNANPSLNLEVLALNRNLHHNSNTQHQTYGSSLYSKPAGAPVNVTGAKK